MEKRLKELIDESDQIIVGIGNEWNWIRSGLKEDKRYTDILKYSEKEENSWLLPIVEFEYGYYNNNEKIDEAYKALRKLIGQKKYFLISELFLQDAIMNGFDADNCVYPCGNYRFLQTPDPDEPLMECVRSDDFMALVEKIHGLIEDRNGILSGDETSCKPFFKEKSFILTKRDRNIVKLYITRVHILKTGKSIQDIFPAH